MFMIGELTAPEAVRRDVGIAMDSILTLFKPGAKIAVIVRRPGLPEQDFLMTDDDLAEIAAVLARRAAMVLAQEDGV